MNEKDFVGYMKANHKYLYDLLVKDYEEVVRGN